MLVDSNEPKKVREWLVKHGHTQRRLPYGDYWLHPEDSTLFTVVERKTCSDLIATLGTHRVENLHESLQNATTAVLLVEGTYSVTKKGTVRLGRRDTGIPQAAVLAALQELAFQYGCYILWNMSSDPLTTARALDKMDADLLDPSHISSLLTGGRNKKKTHSKLSPMHQGLIDLNVGIGPKTVTAILGELTLFEFGALTIAELQDIPDIGPTTAGKIRSKFHGSVHGDTR